MIARVLASITAMAGAYNVQKNARDKRLSVGTSESRCRRGPARRLEKKCNFEISDLGFSEELGHDLVGGFDMYYRRPLTGYRWQKL